MIQLIKDYRKQIILIVELQRENTEYKKEINELKTHIMASPEGELYFEAKKRWDINTSKQ